MTTFTVHATDGVARRGTLQLAHGAVETPAFMPVGTIGTVKGLAPAELREIGAHIVLSNTYHLWLRPGRETLVALGGLHRFMAWDRPILTDSGGFQVFSLESRRTLDDDGVTFQSHLDGSTHRFTPENVVGFQEDLGVDVAMMLDICVKLPASPGEVAASVRRTTQWAERGAAAWKRGATALFGIVQGGLDERLREQSARELVALDLPGYAIGGLSVGESRDEMATFTRFTAALLPATKPRYLMGVGTVRDLIAGIDAGVDMFDCVYPTRAGRHGRAITRSGEYNIRNAQYVRDERPVDPDCPCMVCATFTRAYLTHLFRSEELLGPRLLSYHNLAALAFLMADARESIVEGRWPAFRDGVLGGVVRAVNGIARAAAALAVSVAVCGAPALADPSGGAIGLTLDPILGGIHDSYNDQIRLPPVPVPLLEGDYHFSNFEVTGYGLPPTVAIPYDDAIQGQVRLRLTILDATFRIWDAGHRFGVGVGETLYNQTTHYERADFYAPSGGQQQYSRIAGAHYELVARMPLRSGTIETSLRYAPVLLGTQVSTYEDGAPTRFDPERGQQIDGNVRYVHHIGKHMDAVLGVRYVNFTAAYDVPGHPLSDRNAAVLPAFGYLWRP